MVKPGCPLALEIIDYFLVCTKLWLIDGLIKIHVQGEGRMIWGHHFQRLRRTTYLITLLLLIACAPEFVHAQPQSLYMRAAEATFILEVKVEGVGDPLTPGLPSASHTARVKISNILKSPESFKKFTGKQVDVLMKDISNLTTGLSLVVFANAWKIGSTVVLRETSRLEKFNLAQLDKDP